MRQKQPATQEKKSQILAFLRRFLQENGYPPSVREIGEAMGLSSTSTVHSYLRRLEEDGLIRRDPAKNRAIEICAAEETQLRSLPLVGRIAAGVPITAEQYVEDALFVSPTLVRDEKSFLLQVKGESMINAGIEDGDYIIVRPQDSARDGEIVVALIGDEATVKRLYHEGKRIRLQPENDTMDPIYLDEVQIQGVVTGLFRKF